MQDPNYISVLLSAAKSGLGARLLLSKVGSPSQLARNVANLVKSKEHGMIRGYSVDVSYFGTMANSNIMNFRVYCLLGEYPNEGQPYARFNNEIVSHR